MPFASASELKTAQHEILLAVWARLEQARVIDELTKREEYQFWREEFAQGLVCAYDDVNNPLMRVYSDSPGIKITINRELTTTMPSSENIVGGLIKAMSESFANTYYKAKGILPPEPTRPDDSILEREGHS
ncbi:MAG: hypothetical protein ETSY2_30915 [Candidatus Entotheonella gemina]|uniref:Uncharacterized protein n=1 Tax=Candidatus Entotheonella gemina TaxID=1429439 RepID=W4M149_9BACT|nr:MAG: hypothetical protein ETSY2_30915 [Candidatus Entotheonella gemina]